MQIKALILIIIVFMGALVVFNVMNSPEESSASIAATQSQAPKGSADSITAKPLGEQPKAIVDKASDKIEEAQALEEQKREAISKL